MNEAANLVAESLLGKSFKTVVLAGKAYTLRPLTIKPILRGIRHLSKVEVDENETLIGAIGKMSALSPPLIAGLAELIVGDVRFSRVKVWRLKKRLGHCTCSEIKTAFDDTIPFIGAEDFFASAAFASSVARMAAKQK